MRKITSLVLLLFAGYIGAQTERVGKIKEMLQGQFPALVLEDKLLFVASEVNGKTYSIDELSELNRTAGVYEFAKLKGGSKGLICVLIVKDSSREIELNKNGISKVLKLKIPQGNPIELEKPVFVQADGSEKIQALDEVKIFKTVNALITR
jgi:hypothetical protein